MKSDKHFDSITDILFMVRPDLGVAVCTKSGLNTMRCTGLPRKSKAKNKNIKVRIYIRNPIERLKSAWAMFTGLGEFPRGGNLLSWEDFIDKLLDEGYSDQHWNPQIPQHKTYDEIYRLENINETWPGEHITHENIGTYKKPVTDYRMNDLERFFKADLKAWDRAV